MLTVAFRRRSADPTVPAIVPVGAGQAPPLVAAAARAAGFSARSGEVFEPAASPRTLLLGLGENPSRLDAERAGAEAASRLPDVQHAALVVGDACAAETIASLVAGIALRSWRFDRHRTRHRAPTLSRLTVVGGPTALRPMLDGAMASVRGCLFARDLVSEPANRLTTRDFVRRLEDLAELGIHVDVLGRKRLARGGYGGLLAVGRGSATPPRLAVLRWRGTLAASPVVFVGKGVVFDTGGLSIKPARGMEAMRADMAGAAACAGALLSLALRRSPAPAAAVLAIAENATGAESYRPSDVIRMGSGRTVEIVDTDAEGRLVLADALHHALTTLRPRAMVDVATLTGAIVNALGHHRAGLFGTDEALMASLAAAGERVGERLWPMPMAESHRADLASDIADLRQCVPNARGEGGWAARFIPDACHAASFLREFAGDVPWAHLDIAGVDTLEEAHPLGPAGPTGFGARLLDELVAMRFEEEEHHAAA